MRQKTRVSLRPNSPVEGDHTPIDPVDTARQLAAFETSVGWQHGVFGVLVAVVGALLWQPLRSFLRSGSRDRR
jgi:hypothetical protein